MMGVVVACGPLIEAAAPSLMPAMDISNSNDRFSYWQLWDTRAEKCPTVAKYATTPDGAFRAGTIVISVASIDVFGIDTLDDFLQALRGIEAAGS